MALELNTERTETEPFVPSNPVGTAWHRSINKPPSSLSPLSAAWFFRVHRPKSQHSWGLLPPPIGNMTSAPQRSFSKPYANLFCRLVGIFCYFPKNRVAWPCFLCARSYQRELKDFRRNLGGPPGDQGSGLAAATCWLVLLGRHLVTPVTKFLICK